MYYKKEVISISDDEGSRAKILIINGIIAITMIL